jgi:hypothetical protein
LAGCGSSRQGSLASGLLGLVTQRDIDATAAASPQRTVVEWFQAIQFRDGRGTFDMLGPAERHRLGYPVVASATDVVGVALGRPNITSTNVSGTRARVTLTVEGYLPQTLYVDRYLPPDSTTRLTITLSRVGVGWLIDDASYLLRSAREIGQVRRTAVGR